MKSDNPGDFFVKFRSWSINRIETLIFPHSSLSPLSSRNQPPLPHLSFPSSVSVRSERERLLVQQCSLVRVRATPAWVSMRLPLLLHRVLRLGRGLTCGCATWVRSGSRIKRGPQSGREARRTRCLPAAWPGGRCASCQLVGPGWRASIPRMALKWFKARAINAALKWLHESRVMRETMQLACLARLVCCPG